MIEHIRKAESVEYGGASFSKPPKKAFGKPIITNLVRALGGIQFWMQEKAIYDSSCYQALGEMMHRLGTRSGFDTMTFPQITLFLEHLCRP